MCIRCMFSLHLPKKGIMPNCFISHYEYSNYSIQSLTNQVDPYPILSSSQGHKILEVCSYRIVLSLLTPLEQVPEQTAPWTDRGVTGCEPESLHSNIANQGLKSLALKSQYSQVLGRRGGQDALFRQLEWKKGKLYLHFPERCGTKRFLRGKCLGCAAPLNLPAPKMSIGYLNLYI